MVYSSSTGHRTIHWNTRSGRVSHLGEGAFNTKFSTTPHEYFIYQVNLGVDILLTTCFLRGISILDVLLLPYDGLENDGRKWFLLRIRYIRDVPTIAFSS